MRHPIGAVALLAAAILTLTACAPTAPPEFERDQTAADRPDAIRGSAADSLDVATLRHVGAVDGYDVYLSRGVDGGTSLCVALVLDGIWRSTGCGAEGGVALDVRPGVRIEAGAFDGGGGDPGEQLSESVRVVRK